MVERGYKFLTLDTWLEPDSVSSSFGQMRSDGSISIMTKEDWAILILEPRLSTGVPQGIRSLFEVAQGAMLYGFFFYPVFTLALEQLYTVLEAAVRIRCETLGVPLYDDKHQPVAYRKLIQELMQRRVLDRKASSRWYAFRKLRNMFSHPSFQTILPPTEGVSTLRLVAQELNMMFGTNPIKVTPEAGAPPDQ